jgi:hypothetical protein
MEKIKIKTPRKGLYGPNDYGEPSSSSGYNSPKLVEWVSDKDNTDTPHLIYVDRDMFEGINNPDPNKMGWVLESREIIPDVIDAILKRPDLFKASYKRIFTCQLELLALGEPFCYVISNAVTWIKPENQKIHDKTKLVSMIASNKRFCNGHLHRIQWADKLAPYVDLYGSGRPNELINKEDGLVDYMFSVAIENDASDAYFTEKLTDCFATGTVPIYYGSKRVIDEYFDERGVIWLNSTDDIKNLTKEKYYEMMPYIQTNFEASINLPTSEDFITYTYLQ